MPHEAAFELHNQWNQNLGCIVELYQLNARRNHEDLPCDSKKVFEELIKKYGADYLKKNDMVGFPLLHYAALLDARKCINFIIASTYSKIGNIQSNDHLLPIMFARDPKTKNLLSQVTDINYRYDNNQTALHMVAASGNIDYIYVLVKNFGANVNLHDDRGWTPLMLAMFQCHSNNQMSLLTRIMEIITSAKPDINAIDEKDGLTPLFAAIKAGDYFAVRLLIEQLHADIKKKSKGKTPLQYAQQLLEQAEKTMPKRCKNGPLNQKNS